MNKRHFLTFCCLSVVLLADAQTNVQIKFINMQEMIYYVIPFYIITLTAFTLFIQKIIRPSFSNKWLYICTIAGIIGAGVISFKFKEIKNDQFLKTEERFNLGGEERNKQQEDAQATKEEFNAMLASYWNVAIPNIILLCLGIAVDVRDRKNAKQKA